MLFQERDDNSEVVEGTIVCFQGAIPSHTDHPGYQNAYVISQDLTVLDIERS